MSSMSSLSLFIFFSLLMNVLLLLLFLLLFETETKIIIGCASRGQGSSTQSTTRTRSRSRPSQVPKHCGCIYCPVLWWSGTNTNPDKPFFDCPNYNTRGKIWCEFFLWIDDVEEEEEEHKGRLDSTANDNEHVRVNLA
ncbi:hypothetical protein Ahy_B02g061103 [Arachis hypogaea]|uniref:Zinc finger GRF-type domain-containing protein n=1 Tax=Arachis hypogaea TaxID=3818 RepID=A0A445AK18_ARAHY|nr:hypothetical protein Ahy_B02g061103 [Arachis hypogaea]